MVAETATALRRGLAILFALAGEEAAVSGGLGVTRIAQLVGREKSQVSRSLKVLGECGAVDRDPDTLNYRIGWRLFALAARAGDQRLLEAAPPFLRQVVRQVGERAHLSVLQSSEVLTLMSESPNHAVQAAGWVGRTVPVHCTSAGRALLFDLSRAEVEALLVGVEFSRLGPNAPRDVDELCSRLAAEREQGFALVDEEFEKELVAVAAPVRGFRGSIVAALNISAPKFRFGSRLESAGQEIKLVADELSGVLGWTAGQAPALAEVAELRRGDA